MKLSFITSRICLRMKAYISVIRHGAFYLHRTYIVPTSHVYT